MLIINGHGYILDKLKIYIVSNFRLANRHILQDMNYFLVLGFGQVTSDGLKAMHKSPLCISTSMLKNCDKLANFSTLQVSTR